MPGAVLPTITMPHASSFRLRPDQVETLAQSEGFLILRRHLAHYYKYSLCDHHTSSHSHLAEQWFLIRDLLHALLVPVVELFDHACEVSAVAVRSDEAEDLRRAFSGQASSAFEWLRRFLSTEEKRAWCYTRGCPACVVEQCLSSEATIRLLYTACLLSDVHYPFTMDGPKLPSFMFFIDVLAKALAEENSFGENFLEMTAPKAVVMRDGVEDLIQQTVEIDAVLSQPATPGVSTPGSSLGSSLPTSPMIEFGAEQSQIELDCKCPLPAQMHLQVADGTHMDELLQQCWSQLHPEAEKRIDHPHALTLVSALKIDNSCVAIAELSPE